MHYHLGMAYLQAGEVDKAKKSLQRALAMSQNFEGADEARKTLASFGGDGNPPASAFVSAGLGHRSPARGIEEQSQREVQTFPGTPNASCER